MEIYFEPEVGYFLSEVPESKTKLQLSPKTKTEVAMGKAAEGIIISKIIPGKYSIGDRVLMSPHTQQLGSIPLATSEGTKDFFILNECDIMGVFTKVPVLEAI